MRHKIHQIFDRPRPWKKLRAGRTPAEVYTVRTGDGVTLKLRRVRPPSFGAVKATAMLLHGLGANHKGYHFPERSMAMWLAERGIDVWMPDLRGHGDSRVERFDWCIDDYLEQDIPAILDGIRRFSGTDEVHWVGHSMGGILLMAYGALRPQAPIARGITLASALDYGVGESSFAALLALRPVLERMVAVPFGSLTHLLAPAMGRGATRPLESFNVWPSNIEPELVRALHARCFHTIPISLLRSLATTFDPGGLCLQSGVRIMEAAPKFEVPIRMFAGTRDAQVSVEAVELTAQLIGDNAEPVVCGLDYGQEDHYGHWDLLIGKRAQREVWPQIYEWLVH